jgi:hypothetical protein
MKKQNPIDKFFEFICLISGIGIAGFVLYLFFTSPAAVPYFICIGALWIAYAVVYVGCAFFRKYPKRKLAY